ncbi:aryl hydrocarbon receptor repressor [Lepisosteus oculatus]|uniref:Aryl hydrocarbon receptor repressor n=1 Tax=Lepisosteus oculatus TaxID=7918 RepID=W5N6U9_LEPOC|nr:PREDICTED: aryl hydrocarbon receptor repressor [Lepisosteus oculatus]XP_015210430.1 PREDICTED: aryl hydrocarbon receptor repressor [Lepisosteus oculatus]
MIPPGDCMYAGRKRRKPVQKQKPAVVSEKSNPSKRHRDRLNAELDRLASLLPFSPDVISKLDKLSVLRLSVSYLRVKSFFQAIQEKPSRNHISQAASQDSRKDSLPVGSSVTESELLLESLSGFALVVSTDGMIFYASSTIVDYLGFHQTDVMHQNVFDYIHVDDRQEFRRQLHWAMNPPQQVSGQDPQLTAGTGEEFMFGSPFSSQESDGVPPEFSCFLNRCFISRVRCLLDSTSGFLTMQFQGRLKFLYGQKKKTASGASLPPQLALFCVAVPLLLPSITEMKMKSMIMRNKHKPGVITPLEVDQEDVKKKHPSAGTMTESVEGFLLTCSHSAAGQLGHHSSWSPVTKDGIRHKMEVCKSEEFYPQDEPLNFCKTSIGGQKAHSLENPWALRVSAGAVRAGHHAHHLQNRLGKSSHFGKPGGYKTPPGCHHLRNDTPLPKLYGTLQSPGMDGYCTGGIKTEGPYAPRVDGFDARLLPETAIKIEQDSDSENGCDVFGAPRSRAWTGREQMDKRYGYAEGLPLKTEADYYEQYSPCQKSKGSLSPPFNGHYQGMGAGGRPLKCVLNKDYTQFSPQCGGQSTSCVDSPLYRDSSAEPKGYVQQEYKVNYEFKGHSLIHSIKREPVDSPPWAGGHLDVTQHPLQQHIMPNCVMSSGAQKSNPYAYLQ